MSKRTAKILLQDMQIALERVFRYTKSIDFEEFEKDTMCVDAVVRNLEIIGEAVKRLPENFKESHREIPWHRIAGMRNRIVHDYFGIDNGIIWQIVHTEHRTGLRRIATCPAAVAEC